MDGLVLNTTEGQCYITHFSISSQCETFAAFFFHKIIYVAIL
jgi:hypothetical protein